MNANIRALAEPCDSLKGFLPYENFHDLPTFTNLYSKKISSVLCPPGIRPGSHHNLTVCLWGLYGTLKRNLKAT